MKESEGGTQERKKERTHSGITKERQKWRTNERKKQRNHDRNKEPTTARKGDRKTERTREKELTQLTNERNNEIGKK